MSLIPEVKCRRCGETFSSLRSRCPNCGTRRVSQSTRTPGATPGTVKGTASYDRAFANTRWQMIFGLNTIPAFRREGCAGRLIEAFKKQAKEEGRKGMVLTCKDRLVHYYARFGFENEGVSASTHGHVVWYQMRLTF